jgi:hypothetical protein
MQIPESGLNTALDAAETPGRCDERARRRQRPGVSAAPSVEERRAIFDLQAARENPGRVVEVAGARDRPTPAKASRSCRS